MPAESLKFHVSQHRLSLFCGFRPRDGVIEYKLGDSSKPSQKGSSADADDPAPALDRAHLIF
jgi:hypothetical protein